MCLLSRANFQDRLREESGCAKGSLGRFLVDIKLRMAGRDGREADLDKLKMKGFLQTWWFQISIFGPSRRSS